MKELKSKKTSKQIIFIIIVVMLCNFIVPNYSYAVSTEFGGSLVKVISQFTCSILDAVINYLQDMFISPLEIKAGEKNYVILYSPGTIFAGQIPAFDINFIEPMEKKESTETDRYILLNDINTGEIKEVFNRLKENRIKSDGWYSIGHFADSWGNEVSRIRQPYNYESRDYRGEVSYTRNKL